MAAATQRLKLKIQKTWLLPKQDFSACMCRHGDELVTGIDISICS